jgi:4-hydroxy-tetrahydrodipicolinate synthase
LLDEYGERIYFKPEATPPGPRLSAIRDRTGSGARLFGGTGGISFVDCYRRGLVGTMPGSGMADAFIVAWRHLQAGEDNHAYRLTLPFCALVALHQGIDGFLIVEKIILKRRGIFKNTLIRGPNGFIADAETIQEIHRLTDMIIEEMAQGRQS